MSAAEKIISLDVVRQAREQGEGKKRMQDGFVAIPNAVFDAAYSADLTPTERDILFAVCRKTYGFGKQVDDITITQLASYANIKRQNASPAFNALVERNIISAGKGKHGYMVSVNHPELWLMEPLEGQRRKGKTKEKAPSEIQTTECIADIQSSEIQTHNRQPQQTVEEASASLSPAVADDAAGTRLPNKPAGKKSAAPVADLFALYNAELGNALPAALALSDPRKRALSARWREMLGSTAPNGTVRYAGREDGLTWWAKFFRKVKLNPHWMGENDRGWTADLDWIIKPANFTKVLEYRSARREAR